MCPLTNDAMYIVSFFDVFLFDNILQGTFFDIIAQFPKGTRFILF